MLMKSEPLHLALLCLIQYSKIHNKLNASDKTNVRGEFANKTSIKCSDIGFTENDVGKVHIYSLFSVMPTPMVWVKKEDKKLDHLKLCRFTLDDKVTK